MLSPGMQKYLEGLEALHSAQNQADGSIAAGRTVRREPVTTKHPLIRTHSVTGWKSVFFNPGFVTDIVGVPKAESNAIINYLNELIATTPEIHARFQWQKNDVAFWDNRICVSIIVFGAVFRGLISIESLCFLWVCPPPSSCGSGSRARRASGLRPGRQVTGRGTERSLWPS